MSNEEKEKQGFKVTDRRGFTAEGDRREGAPPGPEATEAKGEARVGADPGRSAAATPPPPPKGRRQGSGHGLFILHSLAGDDGHGASGRDA